MASKRKSEQMAKAVSVNLNEILVIHCGGELSGQVLQSLRDKRFATRIVSNFASVATGIKGLTEPIILVESGISEDSLDLAAKELGRLAATYQLPVILVGDGADAYERALDKLFPAATTLNAPYGSAEILAAINYLSRTYMERKTRRSSERAKEKDKEPGSVTENRVSHKVYAEFEAVPELVFEQLDRLDLWKKSLGGAPFSGANMEIDSLAKLDMLPKDGMVFELIKTLTADAGKWGRTHLVRTSYMAQRILGAMSPEEALVENLKISAFLYAWSFAGNNIELLKRPYFEARSPQYRLELCSKIKDSALQIQSELKYDQAGNIVAMLARLIGQEQALSDDDTCITASALMAADLTSRVCYEHGHWNPRRANQFLTKLKQGKIQDLHPAVLCCTVKFIAEAIAAHTPLFLLPKELRQNKKLLAEIRAQEKAPVAKGEKRIPLSQLTPGMQLSRPLVSMDGKEILSPDIKLDEDLIWRIWQLSAVRPLNAPIIIN